jgi:hypothetical protein
MNDRKSVITDAEARAIEASAKAAERAIAAFEGLGGWASKVLGTVPEDIVGILGGDWLRVRRSENLANMLWRAIARLDARKQEPSNPALSLTIPIMVAAAEESRDELQDIWARLLAAALDPTRQRKFRILFIEVAKKLDPVDAVVLRELGKKPRIRDVQESVQYRRDFPKLVNLTPDETSVSLSNLGSLRLVDNPPADHQFDVSALGREFLRAIED